MEAKYTIALIAEGQIESILPLVRVLNHGSVTTVVLKERLKDMLALGNYQCIGVYDKEELIGICGFWTLHKLYIGKHLEPDNVFIAKTHRSKGIGKLMLDWVKDYAKENNCNSLEINCYVDNKRGIQFWEDQGYEPEGYHMRNVFNRGDE